MSVTIARDMDLPDRSLTLAMMQWTQFVEHDLAHTPTSKMGENRVTPESENPCRLTVVEAGYNRNPPGV